MADTPMARGTIFFPEISGADHLPGDRLLLASDEHGLRIVERAVKQLRSGRVKPEEHGALGDQAKDLPLEDCEDVSFDGGEFVYLLASHARSRRGKSVKPRYRLGRLRLEGGGGFSDLRHSDGLWWAVLAELPPLASAAVRTPAAGGLNIEGLTFDRKAECLVVGLRSPTVTVAKKRASKLQEDAVVLRVSALSDLFDDDHADDSAKLLDVPTGDDEERADPGYVGKVSLLDLGGQGVRGLCHDPGRGAMWVLSGLSTDPNHPVAQPWGLWLWDGRAAPRRTQLPADLGLASPEAICLLNVEGEPHLLIVDDSEVDESLLMDGQVDVRRLEAASAGCRYVLLPTDRLRT
jgi:hypothetical protein